MNPILPNALSDNALSEQAQLENAVQLAPIALPSVHSHEPSESAEVITLHLQEKALCRDTLQDYIQKAVTLLYGPQAAAAVCLQLTQIVDQFQAARPVSLKRQDRIRRPDWYKNTVLYSLYVDSFGTTDEHNSGTFDSLAGHLDYFKALGVDALHILPFLDSPMMDAGFDISDYRRVRPELGGNAAFERFMLHTKEKQLYVMMDMVLNHASEAHPDFQAALHGDTHKMARFLYKEQMPAYQRCIEDGQGVIVEYQDGSRIRLMLSDNAETHYNLSLVNGMPHYFYSTFMPEQKDWNWSNPDVLFEHLTHLGFWANQGIDIFRLDALPFLIKEPGGKAENTPGTHAVIQILSACMQVMAPSTVLLAEAAMPPDELSKYHGKEQTITVGHKQFKRSDKVQMSYNFPLMSTIWTSMVTENAQPIFDILKEAPKLPGSSTQINFVRVHDELSMESVKAEWQQSVYAALSTRGEGCRSGVGVAGRVANFVDHDPQRATLLYSILFSLPGTPLLYYGDDLMAVNNPDYMNHAAQIRAKSITISEKHVDKRDINRGPLSASLLQQAQEDPHSVAGQLFKKLQRLIAVRKHSPALNKGRLLPVSSNNSNTLCYLRQMGRQRVLILQNLSAESTTSTLKMPTRTAASKATSKALRDLISDQIVSLQPGRRQQQVEAQLAPYQTLWLKLD